MVACRRTASGRLLRLSRLSRPAISPRVLIASPDRRGQSPRCIHTENGSQRRSRAVRMPAPRVAYPAVLVAGQRRRASVVADATVKNENRDDIGPIQEYDRRVDAGLIRNDEHQRGIIQSLQHLHDELRHYRGRPVFHPSTENLKTPKSSLFASWFGGGGAAKTPIQDIPNDLPQGLYLYGDVGSGKTMLMDLFYETLPSSVRSKTRIHFHNFMQDVHRRLHKMKMQHGNDIDGVPFVAADIAEQGNVLCFDEFQCTDVADAMILRRCVRSPKGLGAEAYTAGSWKLYSHAPIGYWKRSCRTAWYW